MITIKNVHVLYGENMDLCKANIIIEENEIIEVSEKLLKGKIIDGKGCIAAPSLINSHVHIGDSVAKDIGDGYPIDKIVKPPNGIKHQILAKTSSQDIIDAIQCTIDLMFQTGTTTFVDFREGGFEGIDLLKKAGANSSITKIILGRHESFYNSNNSRSELKKTIKMILKSCDGIGLSGFGEVNDEITAIITDICRKNSKLSSIHVAEYEELQINSLKLTGETEVERALKAGFDLLIHVTSPLNDDLKLISETGTSVVSCPRSNGSLGVGIPPLKEMLDLGINICLGTDNLMFNSPNMFSEMEFALKLTRAYYRKYISPVEIFKMATVNPAKALHLNSGMIKEGKLADIMLVNRLSGDPILSLINRTQTQNINALIKEGNIVFKRYK